MPLSANPRSTSNVVATKPGCAPFKEAYEQAVDFKPKRWSEVEETFLRAMERFDQNVATGLADMGDLQNGKRDFFNDLLALLLENCAGVQLCSRPAIPGLTFPKHKLDLSFPSTGVVEFILEAKAVGTPRHPLSPKAKAIGRAGSADLDKLGKEIGFRTIDLKAGYARIMAARGQRASARDLTTWLHLLKPKSYLFISARLASDDDRDRVIRFTDMAGRVSDAVGIFCFRPVSSGQPDRYKVEPVPFDIEIGRVLSRACQDLKAIKESKPADSSTATLVATLEEFPLAEEGSV